MFLRLDCIDLLYWTHLIVDEVILKIEFYNWVKSLLFIRTVYIQTYRYTNPVIFFISQNISWYKNIIVK